MDDDILSRLDLSTLSGETVNRLRRILAAQLKIAEARGFDRACLLIHDECLEEQQQLLDEHGRLYDGAQSGLERASRIAMTYVAYGAPATTKPRCYRCKRSRTERIPVMVQEGHKLVEIEGMEECRDTHDCINAGRKALRKERGQVKTDG